MHATSNTKSYYNLHPRHSSIHSDNFFPAGNECHFLTGNANNNGQTCKSTCFICEKILTKQGKISDELLFKI